MADCLFNCHVMLMVFLKVILQKSEVESVVHSPGDYILLSADKYKIKVGVVSIADPCEQLTLSGPDGDASQRSSVLCRSGL